MLKITELGDADDEVKNSPLSPELMTVYGFDEGDSLSDDFDPDRNGFNRVNVDREYVDTLTEAFMRTVPNFRHWAPSDKARHECHLRHSLREGCIVTDPHRFWPPRRLTRTQYGENSSADVFWPDVAESLLNRAQDVLLNSDESTTLEEINRVLAKLKETHGALAVSDVRPSYALRDHSQYLYFYYDAAHYSLTPEQIIEQVDAVKDTYYRLLRKKVAGIVRDLHDMRLIFKTAETFRRVTIECVMEDEISRAEFIQEDLETEEDKRLFMSLVTQAVSFLDHAEDVNVKPLPVRDAVIHGCKGLCKLRCKGGDKGYVSDIKIPMTDFYKGRLLSLDEVFEIVAHEVAHHQDYAAFDVLRGKHGKTDEGYEAIKHLHDEHRASHNQIHNLLTQRNLKVLRSLRIDVVRDPDTGRMDVKVSRGDQKEEVKRGEDYLPSKRVSDEALPSSLADVVTKLEQKFLEELRIEKEWTAQLERRVDVLEGAGERSDRKGVDGGADEARSDGRQHDLEEREGRIENAFESTGLAVSTLKQRVDRMCTYLEERGKTWWNNFGRVEKLELLRWMDELELRSLSDDFTAAVVALRDKINGVKHTYIGAYPKIRFDLMLQEFIRLREIAARDSD